MQQLLIWITNSFRGPNWYCMTGCAIEVLHCSILLGTMAVSNNRAVCLELLYNQQESTEHCHPTIETATRFIVTRSKEAAVWFSRKPKCLPLPLQNVCLCLPLLIPIYYTGKNRRPLLRRTEVGIKNWGIVKGAGVVSVHLQLVPCSSCWELTWNTLTLQPPHTHLTSIKDTDGGPSLWGELWSHLLAPLL